MPFHFNVQRGNGMNRDKLGQGGERQSGLHMWGAVILTVV